MERTEDFLLHWLNTTESLGFIICFIVFGIIIFHIYFQRIRSHQKIIRGHNENIKPTIKWLALLSIFLYSLSCLTHIFAKDTISFKWKHIWFILTQFCYGFASITSYLLFIYQLNMIYNKSSNIYAISTKTYIILFIFIICFSIFMFSKSILIIFLDKGYLTTNEYGKSGAITVYGSSLIDLIITIFILYLFNSRLTITMKQIKCDIIKNKSHHEILINIRLKHTILTSFAIITSQIYLILWSITILIWYNYSGNKKQIYVYDFTIITITFRTIGCCVNSLVILLNFKFSDQYYNFCCFPVLWCWKRRKIKNYINKNDKINSNTNNIETITTTNDIYERGIIGNIESDSQNGGNIITVSSEKQEICFSFKQNQENHNMDHVKKSGTLSTNINDIINDKVCVNNNVSYKDIINKSERIYLYLCIAIFVIKLFLFCFVLFVIINSIQ